MVSLFVINSIASVIIAFLASVACEIHTYITGNKSITVFGVMLQRGALSTKGCDFIDRKPLERLSLVLN